MKLITNLLICFLLALPLIAEDTVVEPETKTTFAKTIGEEPLTLFGIAPRIKNILGLYGAKVYGLGLYVDTVAMDAALGDGVRTPARFAAAVKAMRGHRAFVLKFVRDLDRQVMSDAFREGIELSLSVDDPRIAEDATKFLAAFTDIKNGDEAVLDFKGNVVSLYGNGEQMVSVENRTLARAIISTYIGTNPVDGKLKEKLLSGLK